MFNSSSVVTSASVVITSYNYAEFVGSAIKSALSQTFANVEVIVVDDGSTDDSLAVIRSFGDRVILIAQENNGVAASEYAGFARATGDLIIFLDSDDILYPTAVEETVALCTSETSKVQFYLEYIDRETSPLGFTHPKLMPSEGEIEKLLFSFGIYPFPPTSGNAYSRRFLQNVLPCLYSEIAGHTDMYMSALAPIYGRVKVSEKILGGYRVHGNNMFGRNPGILLKPSLQRIRSEILATAATQRSLEAHSTRLNKPVRSGLYWKLPHICKRRLISLQADPTTHPFPEDRPFRVAWYGLAATFLCTKLPFINRVKLYATFLLLPFLPPRLANVWMPVLDDGGRLRLIDYFGRTFRSALARVYSPEKAPRL